MRIYFVLNPTSPFEEYQYSDDLRTVVERVGGFKFEKWAGEKTALDNNYDFEVVKYVKFLECDPDFERKIITIREEFGIPTKGYDPGEHNKYLPLLNHVGSMEAFNEMEEGCNAIQKRCDQEFADYKIPFSLKKSLLSVVTNNFISTFGNYAIEASYAKDDSDIPIVRITIDLYAPMIWGNEIPRRLRNNWNEIQRMFPSIGKPSVLDDMDIMNLEILDLKNKTTLTHREIADIINERYGLKGEEALSYTNIGDRVYEMKKKSEKISKA